MGVWAYGRGGEKSPIRNYSGQAPGVSPEYVTDGLKTTTGSRKAPGVSPEWLAAGLRAAESKRRRVDTRSFGADRGLVRPSASDGGLTPAALPQLSSYSHTPILPHAHTCQWLLTAGGLHRVGLLYFRALYGYRSWGVLFDFNFGWPGAVGTAVPADSARPVSGSAQGRAEPS
jgi:hypothetical protein